MTIININVHKSLYEDTVVDYKAFRSEKELLSWLKANIGKRVTIFTDIDTLSERIYICKKWVVQE